MPAGAGPVPVTITAAAVNNAAEAVIGTLGPANWNNPSGLGMLIEFEGQVTTPATAGSLVLKVRQGNAVTGAQVGPTVTIPVGATTTLQVGIKVNDVSAFGTAQNLGQYVLTAQYAAAAGATLTGLLTLETCAPIL